MPFSSIPVHTYAECKELWQRLDDSEKKAVQGIASLVWRTSDHYIPQDIPSELIAPLVARGVIVENNGRTEFALPQLLYFANAINAVDAFQDKRRTAEDVVELLLNLLRLQSHRPYTDTRALVSFVLAHLVNSLKYSSIVEFLVGDGLDKSDFWTVYDPLHLALPILELPPERLASVLELGTRQTSGDLMQSSWFAAAAYLGAYQPEASLKILSSISQADSQTIGGVLHRLMLGVASTSTEKRDELIELSYQWLGTRNPILTSDALFFLSTLSYQEDFPSEAYLATSVEIDPTIEGVGYALAVTLTGLGMKFSKHAQDCLTRLKKLKEDKTVSKEACLGIARGLRQYSQGNGLNFRLSALKLLTDVPVSDENIIQNIDALLTVIPSEDAWRFLEEWIDNHTEGVSVGSSGMFQRSIKLLYRKDPVLGKQILTRWFSADNYRFVDEAHILLTELDITEFAAEVIATMTPQRTIYMTEKLLAWPLSGKRLLPLFLSIICATTALIELEEYFVAILSEIAWNLPGITEKFLTQKIPENDNLRVSSILERVLTGLEAYHEQRKGIFPAELQPSVRRVRQFLAFQQKKMSEAQEAAYAQSPFLNLISRVDIARGDASFYMNVFHPDLTQRRTFSPPSGFNQIEHEIELPRGDLLDPTDSIAKRIRRRVLLRDDIKYLSGKK